MNLLGCFFLVLVFGTCSAAHFYKSVYLLFGWKKIDWSTGRQVVNDKLKQLSCFSNKNSLKASILTNSTWKYFNSFLRERILSSKPKIPIRFPLQMILVRLPINIGKMVPAVCWLFGKDDYIPLKIYDAMCKNRPAPLCTESSMNLIHLLLMPKTGRFRTHQSHNQTSSFFVPICKGKKRKEFRRMENRQLFLFLPTHMRPIRYSFINATVGRFYYNSTHASHSGAKHN